MINFDDVARGNIIEENVNQPQIPNHPYRIQIIGGSGSTETNTLITFIKHQPGFEKRYLYAQDVLEGKYHFFYQQM